MTRDQAFKWAGIGAIALIGFGVLEALGHRNFVYGFGLSIACNLGTIALGLALLGSLFAIDPLCRYFKYEPHQVHWALKTLFVVACLTAALVVIPRPRDCPTNDTYGDDYP